MNRASCEYKDRIEPLRRRIAEPKTEDFGRITELSSPFPPPEVYPRRGSHPRIFVTPESLPALRERVKHPENAAMLEKYTELSDMETDGTLKDGVADLRILAAIESKAFRYLLEGDETYGYGAILAIKNYILELGSFRALDACRVYGYVMYTAALVYDWCYDLMTPADREQLTAGVQTKLAPRFEMGFPPLGQGGVTGHGTEAQLYRDWLSYAIASFDEYPDIYELVVGRLYATHRDAASFYMRSGAHWQGASYGPYRYFYMLIPQALLLKMTNGEHHLFSEDLHRVAYYILHSLRPDRVPFQIGDGVGLPQYRAAALFLASALYRDPLLKGFAKEGLEGFTAWTNYTYSAQLTPVTFLCLNDPAVIPDGKYIERLPLVGYFGSPRGNIIARSAWEKDAAAVYMKIGEAYSGNHEHRDAGHFTIYYKAPLATDSGVYGARYGGRHDYNYLKQTVAHNCMLVYNPALDNVADSEKPYHSRYSGGQILHRGEEFPDLLAWVRSRACRQARIIGADYLCEDGKKYCRSYLAGDLTAAYDTETVEDYCRYMLSVMTDDPTCPMAFFVLDRLTATDPAFKKTFLLHTFAAPTVDHAAATATVTYGGGRLHLQTLLERTACEVIGGPEGETVDGAVNETERRFWVRDRNYYAEDDPSYVPSGDKGAGWGRLEISPTAAEKTSCILNVMYVTDAENGAPTVPAREIRGEGLVGASIFGKTVLFPSGGGRLAAPARFAGEGESEYLVAGLAAGRWCLSLDGDARTVSVADGALLTFTARASEISLAPVL